jgi:hypothetical protein
MPACKHIIACRDRRSFWGQLKEDAWMGYVVEHVALKQLLKFKAVMSKQN